MDVASICSVCHINVKSTDYFCFNCGHNLHPKPLSTSINSQIILYVKSFLLPPMGFIWGFRYLRQKDNTSKAVGIIAMIITVLILLITIQYTNNLINSINNQVNNQFQNLQGL